MNSIITVFHKDTKEILAVIVNDGQSICRNDIDFAVYNDTEPILAEIDGKVYLDQSKFMLHI